MERRIQCQIAERIDETIGDLGIKPRTAPYRWIAGLLGPLFERKIPMRSASYHEQRTRVGLLAYLLPVTLCAFGG